MNPFTLIRLVGQAEFQQALVVGGVAALVLLIVRVPGWLLTWGVAAFAALSWTGRLTSGPDTPAWALPATLAVAVAGSLAFRALPRRAPDWSVGVVFALWVLGVWGTVPDTERAVVTLGVAAGMLPALWPGLRVPMQWPGALVAIAALGFVTATDGTARTSAMIGSYGMVGLPVVAAAVLATQRDVRLSPWALIGAQALHVIVSGRVAGQWSGAVGAVVVVVLSALVTGAALFLFGRSRAGRGQPAQQARQTASSKRRRTPSPLVVGPSDSSETPSASGGSSSPTDSDRGRSKSGTPLLKGFYRPPNKP